MLIDKTKTFCFKVEDVDKLWQMQICKVRRLPGPAYSLKDAVEKDAFQYIPDFANAGTAIAATITSANVLSIVSEMARQLYENNVPDSNMFMVIPRG